MATKKQQSFSKLYHLSIFSNMALLLLLLGSFWIYHEYKTHLADIDELRKEYIETNKQEVYHQVNIHLDDVRFMISTVESQLRHNLQTQTNNGWAIANNIYNANKDSLNDAQIKKLIIEALMPLRFFNGRGYYWILDTDHRVVAHPFATSLIGKNQENLTDRQGQTFIRNSIRVAQQKEEGGFVTYYWNKPDISDKLHIEKGEKKIAFLKLFKPYGWIIGTGEYVYDVEKQLQKQFLARLNTIHYGEKGYIFTHTFDGVRLSRHDSEITDKKVAQNIIETGRKPGGGFVEFTVNKTSDTIKPSQKINYINSLDEWQWIIGAGFYLDGIDNKIEELRQDMLSELYHRALSTAVIILVILVTSYWISQLFSKRLAHELGLFSAFFKRAATNPEKIDADQMTITEFSDLAATANQMIEERQKFQSDLQQSKEVWERSFNAISDLVTIHDKNSRIIRVNQAACNFLNKKPEEIIGKHCYEVFQQSAEQCQNCPGNKTLLDKLSHTETIPFLPQKKTFQISTAPTFDDNGQLEYVVHVAKDISEQKQLEEELVQSQKMEAIGTLAGGIAHDFNNILTSLLGYADLAKEEAGDDNHQAHYIGQVITAGNRASALVKQILAFSRKSEVSREHISAEQIINESLKLLRASIPSTIKINTQITPTEDTIFADPAKIHQIMVNLCTNAQHAIGEQQGIITINLSSKNLTQDEIPDQSGTEPGTFLELTVTDTGHGISSDIIDHIFDPYFTTKEVGKGIGMGLAVIHGIVKELGGIIKVESKAKEGASFHVFLPAAPRDDQEASTSAPKSPPRNGNERILVVDDEEDISFMLKGGLERFGYRVSARTNSAEALAEFASSPNDFNLIITDQTMPDMTGTAMAKEVLKLRPDMPIILYSGYSDLVAGKAAKDIGIRKFLLKPIDSKTMAEHIRKILDENQTVTGKA